MPWYAYGRQTEMGNMLSVIHTWDVIDPVAHIEKHGDYLGEFDHELSEAEKDLLLARIDVPIIEEEP